MRVLHIFREKNEGKIGGVEYHVQYLVREQSRIGITPIILSFSKSKKNEFRKEIREGVTWYFLTEKDPFLQINHLLKPLRNGRFDLAFSALFRVAQNFDIQRKLDVINEIAPNLIHQHDYLSSIRLSKSLSNVFPVIFTNHYGEYLYLHKTGLGRMLQKRFLKPFSMIIAPSKELLPKLPKARYIPNGVDDSLFKPLSAEEKVRLKKQQGLENKVIFLCARRWAPTKGVLFFVKALNLLSEEVKEKSVFLLAGNDAEDFSSYRKEVQKELDNSNKVDYRLYGNINHNELIGLLNITDVGVIPSLMEGMSLFSVELLSCGIPVLGTEVGGIPEVVETGKNGWLVPSKDAESLAYAITQVVTQNLHHDLHWEAENFAEKYSWKGISKRTKEIYEIII